MSETRVKITEMNRSIERALKTELSTGYTLVKNIVTLGERPPMDAGRFDLDDEDEELDNQVRIRIRMLGFVEEFGSVIWGICVTISTCRIDGTVVG